MHIFMEFLISWLVRVRNKDHLVPFMIALSMLLWIENVHSLVWDCLLFLRLVYCRDWTKNWCIEMAKRQPKPPYQVSTKVYCEGADNNFVLMKVAIQRVGCTHRNVDMIQRIKFYPKALPASEALPPFQRGFSPCIRPFSWNPLFQSFDPALCLLDQALVKSATRRVVRGKENKEKFTSRPAGNRGMKSHCTVIRPMADTSASSGNHIDRFLCKVMRENPWALLFLIGSDQAMEENVVQRMIKRTGQFQRFGTVLDLLHVMMWVLCGLWQLTR